jgi:hypothetical protein
VFRRGGSWTAFTVEGEVPGATDGKFAGVLRKHRFRTIENAASEETSLGWVTPDDPTGETFATPEQDHDGAIWLRVRIDRKTLPRAWIAIYRAAAERSLGRKMTARERRELRADLAGKLLPRVLPNVRFLDALLIDERRRLLLFTTSGAGQAGFCKLFEQSFGARLVHAGPAGAALQARLPREQHAYLREVAPVRWPRADRRPGEAGHEQDGANEERR